MRKNCELRIKLSSILREEVRNVSEGLLALNIQESVCALINLGIQVLHEKKINGYNFSLVPDYERAVKVIQFTKEDNYEKDNK